MTAPEPAVKFAVAQRHEFVRAFVDQAWARPGTDRPVARVHVVLMVTIGVLAGSLITGVVLQLIHPMSLNKPVVAPPQRSSAPTYTAVSGWDCLAGADHGFDVAGRTSAWYTVAHGGWARDGCHGTFEAIPLSGDAQSFDQSQSAVWWFAPAGMTRCEIAVYVPASDDPSDSAASAALYYILGGRNGSAFASFVVDQTSNRGAWKVVGTFPLNQSGVAVRLTNQGVSATPAARLAVTQVRATCTGAQ